MSRGPAAAAAGAEAAAADATLTRTARLIRALFVTQYRAARQAATGAPCDWGARRMPRWDGGRDDHGTHPSVWLAAARLCLARGLDPAAYVAAQFAPGAAPPRPNALTGPGALARYQAAEAGVVDELASQLRIADQLFQTEVGALQALEHLDLPTAAMRAIRDRVLGLPVLYRYCRAHRAGDHAAVARFYEGALAQYVCRRAGYDAAWGAMIPEPLRRAADQFLEQFAQGGA